MSMLGIRPTKAVVVHNKYDALKDKEQEDERIILGGDGCLLQGRRTLEDCMIIKYAKRKSGQSRRRRDADSSMASFMKSSQYVKCMNDFDRSFGSHVFGDLVFDTANNDLNVQNASCIGENGETRTNFQGARLTCTCSAATSAVSRALDQRESSSARSVNCQALPTARSARPSSSSIKHAAADSPSIPCSDCSDVLSSCSMPAAATSATPSAASSRSNLPAAGVGTCDGGHVSGGKATIWQGRPQAPGPNKESKATLWQGRPQDPGPEEEAGVGVDAEPGLRQPQCFCRDPFHLDSSIQQGSRRDKAETLSPRSDEALNWETAIDLGGGIWEHIFGSEPQLPASSRLLPRHGLEDLETSRHHFQDLHCSPPASGGDGLPGFAAVSQISESQAITTGREIPEIAALGDEHGKLEFKALDLEVVGKEEIVSLLPPTFEELEQVPTFEEAEEDSDEEDETWDETMLHESPDEDGPDHALTDSDSDEDEPNTQTGEEEEEEEEDSEEEDETWDDFMRCIRAK